MKSPTATRGAKAQAPEAQQPGSRTPLSQSIRKAAKAGLTAQGAELPIPGQDVGGTASSSNWPPAKIEPVDDWETLANDVGVQQEGTLGDAAVDKSGAGTEEERWSADEQYDRDDRLISRCTELHACLKTASIRELDKHVKAAYKEAAEKAAALLKKFRESPDEKVRPLAAALHHSVEAVKTAGKPWTDARMKARDVLLLACSRGFTEAEMRKRGMPKTLKTRILDAHKDACIEPHKELLSQLGKAKPALFGEPAGGAGGVDVDGAAVREMIKLAREGRLLSYTTTDNIVVYLARAGQAAAPPARP